MRCLVLLACRPTIRSLACALMIDLILWYLAAQQGVDNYSMTRYFAVRITRQAGALGKDYTLHGVDKVGFKHVDFWSIVKLKLCDHGQSRNAVGGPACVERLPQSVIESDLIKLFTKPSLAGQRLKSHLPSWSQQYEGFDYKPPPRQLVFPFSFSSVSHLSADAHPAEFELTHPCLLDS